MSSFKILNHLSRNTCEYLNREVEKILVQYNMKWSLLRCVATDDGKNMCGSNKGSVGKLIKIVKRYLNLWLLIALFMSKVFAENI